MPAITATSITPEGAITVSETTLDGSDTLTYQRGDILVLRNPTGGAISPVIDGAGATTKAVPGVGSIDISGGFAVGSIAAGAVATLRLDSIASYLQGTIAVNSGTGLIAALLRG